MALTLGIRTGKDFFIGDCRVKIMEIVSSTKFRIQYGAAGALKTAEISDEESVGLAENIRLSAGLHGTNELARVVIDAPRDIKILRGFIYREEQKKACQTKTVCN